MEDPEEKFYKEINKIETLEGQLEELTERVDRLELSGLQEQITGLSNRIDELQNELIQTSRQTARNEINNVCVYLLRWVHENRDISDAVSVEMSSYINRASAVVHQKVNDATDPIEASIEYENKMGKYFKDQNLFP